MFLEVLFNAPGQFGGVGEEIFHGAELIDELDRGLFADTRHTWDVIDRISHQSEHVHDLVRPWHPPTFLNLGQAHHFDPLSHARGFVQEGVFIDALGKIFVRRHHIALESLFLGAPNKCSNDIVGFITIADQDRNSKGFEHTAHVRQRLAEVFGHRLAGRLVIGEIRVPLRGSVRVESDRNVGRLLVLENLEQGLCEAIKRGSVHAFRRKNGAAH